MAALRVTLIALSLPHRTTRPTQPLWGCGGLEWRVCCHRMNDAWKDGWGERWFVETNVRQVAEKSLLTSSSFRTDVRSSFRTIAATVMASRDKAPTAGFSTSTGVPPTNDGLIRRSYTIYSKGRGKTPIDIIRYSPEHIPGIYLEGGRSQP